MAYECILTEVEGNVGVLTLHRPKALNAFNQQLMEEVTSALNEFEANDDIGAIVITGGEKAFAAGADIKEMQSLDYMDVFKSDFITSNWEAASRVRKPVIAAVAGYALGGGCELAMMCDFILAADNAKFSQPEITIGTMPGAGGTQRLPRFIGKSKAMEMCLIIPLSDLRSEAIKTAQQIADYSRPAVMLTKESVNRAYEVSLNEGIRFERRVFHSTFATQDQKEGMAAFAEKRKPSFKNR